MRQAIALHSSMAFRCRDFFAFGNDAQSLHPVPELELLQMMQHVLELQNATKLLLSLAF